MFQGHVAAKWPLVCEHLKGAGIASRTNDVTKMQPPVWLSQTNHSIGYFFESDVWSNGARELMHGD